jgi:lysylphosphatidylglycerol synthetase-like protein (DUF2156 family)
LSALVTLLTVLFQLYYRNNDYGGVVNVVIKTSTILFVTSNVALVTYLLGNIKKELDRLSWAIIGIAILGSVLIALGAGFSPWSAVTMILVAGLLNFVEPDE